MVQDLPATEEEKALTLGSILERLQGGVIAGMDDLDGVGECLNLLDELEMLVEPSSSPRAERLKTLRELFNDLLLENFADAEDRWTVIRRSVADLQALATSDGESVGVQGGIEEGKAGGKGTAEESVPSRREVPDDTVAAEAATVAEASSAGDSDKELVRDFVMESREHVSSIELNLLSLETNPEDMQVIDAVFRPFHSIKGVAGFLNLSDIHRLSHCVESLLDSARSGSLSVTNEVIDLVLSSVDLLKILLDDLEGAVSRGETLPCRAEAVDAFVKSLESFQSENDSVGDFRHRKVGDILVAQGVVDANRVEEAARLSKTSGRKLGEELIHTGLATARDVSLALREQRRARENASVVRMDTAKLDGLVDTIGELVIAQSMVLQNKRLESVDDEKLHKDIVQLRRITGDLQRVSMSMRMIPIRNTFQKMIRLVRDLCRKSGKDAILEMEGEDTEIDRHMVEDIYEPLVHLVRNAVDHGIESPEERMEAGKPSQGRLLLISEQRAGQILIEIRDDGRGLDTARIRERAIAKGFLPREEQRSDEDVHQLIFRAGFSTKEEVTDISGRGVGMDVVKKSVEDLRGKLEVSSSPGQGARFRLKLPLTMAIIDGMVLRVGRERYVAPTIAMKEFLQPSPEACFKVRNREEMIRVREDLIPLVRLHEIFEVEPDHVNPWEGLVLIVNEDDRLYGFLADEILGRQEVVIKGLGASMRHVQGVSGGAIMGDGRVVLILDVRGITNLFQERRS